jgi:hypothetical protein
LFDYDLIGELMEKVTFCCLFHEITLPVSTQRDIKDFVSQSHAVEQLKNF